MNKKVINGISFHTIKKTTSIIIINNSFIGKKFPGTHNTINNNNINISILGGNIHYHSKVPKFLDPGNNILNGAELNHLFNQN
jgi:hypothetical protein